MILKKEFYFVRHGQTDHNKQLAKTDHGNISLNDTGRNQAISIAPLLGSFRSIYCSPLQRAKETKELIAPLVPYFEREDLGECTAKIWTEMTSLGSLAISQGSEEVKRFLEQVKRGVNWVLSQEGTPSLIVSHGGVHWAICCLMEIHDHEWMVDNCRPVHFFQNEQGEWSAKTL